MAGYTAEGTRDPMNKQMGTRFAGYSRTADILELYAAENPLASFKGKP